MADREVLVVGVASALYRWQNWERLKELVGPDAVRVNLTPDGRGDACLDTTLHVRRGRRRPWPASRPSRRAEGERGRGGGDGGCGGGDGQGRVFVKPEERLVPFAQLLDALGTGGGGVQPSSPLPGVPYLSHQVGSKQARQEGGHDQQAGRQRADCRAVCRRCGGGVAQNDNLRGEAPLSVLLEDVDGGQGLALGNQAFGAPPEAVGGA